MEGSGIIVASEVVDSHIGESPLTCESVRNVRRKDRHEQSRKWINCPTLSRQGSHVETKKALQGDNFFAYGDQANLGPS